LKFSLGQRLFVAVLLAFVAVGALGIELMRWSFLDNFADPVSAPRSQRLDALAQSLQARYAARHDWSFLPAEPEARRRWLRDELQRQPGADALRSPNLGERIGLVDADGALVTGVLPNPLLIAIASIDTAARPLAVDGRVVGELVLAKPQRPEDELAVAFLVAQQRRLGWVALAGVLASVTAAVLLAANFRRPVRQLVAGARLLEAGRFDTRLPAGRSDELGELALTFNHLAAKLEDTERARQQWMADTSHELRTPLAVLRGQLEALQDGVRAATPENVDVMLAQVLALGRLVDDLQELSRPALAPPPYELAALDAWALVTAAVGTFQERLHAAGLEATVGARPARATVHADADRLRQVLANLLENSVRYTERGGRIEIMGASDDNALCVTIADTAPGVPEPALARLGERFFRVDPSRSRRSGGSGLGLALSRQIVEAHGGRLAFAASPLGGLCAVVTLPLQP
jgi:two-component system sensor histidine kinase BaeS